MRVSNYLNEKIDLNLSKRHLSKDNPIHHQ